MLETGCYKSLQHPPIQTPCQLQMFCFGYLFKSKVRILHSHHCKALGLSRTSASGSSPLCWGEWILPQWDHYGWIDHNPELVSRAPSGPPSHMENLPKAKEQMKKPRNWMKVQEAIQSMWRCWVEFQGGKIHSPLHILMFSVFGAALFVIFRQTMKNWEWLAKSKCI